MARDENDRPHEDELGRSLNPDLTGDVLSPRWSTDDTDEQPAIQVSGNETYILPPDKGAPVEIGDYLSQGGTAFGPHDALSPDPLSSDPLPDPLSSSPSLSGDALSSSDYGLSADFGPKGDDFEPGLGFRDSDYRDSPPKDLADSEPFSGAEGASGPQRLDDDDDAPYLPIDRSYEGPSSDDDPPKKGFLGSGWSDDSDGDHEVRRRTKILLIAAAAVVVLGAGAGWMLTSSSSDDPCAGGHCASVGQVPAPADTPTPKHSTTEEALPTETDAPEPTATETTAPTRTPVRVRSTRTPTPKTSPTRLGQPTTRPSTKATEQPTDQVKPTQTKAADEKEQVSKQTTPTTQAPPPQTQAPAPTPSKKGLLDILFPWA